MVDLLTNINVFKALTIGLLAFIGLRMLLSDTTASRLADRLASLNALIEHNNNDWAGAWE